MEEVKFYKCSKCTFFSKDKDKVLDHEKTCIPIPETTVMAAIGYKLIGGNCCETCKHRCGKDGNEIICLYNSWKKILHVKPYGICDNYEKHNYEK